MLVSVLIPCYNAERWIAQCIESALAQTWKSKEIIVVDDGSTDRSLEVISKFDGLISWAAGPNQGGNRTRNRLLELARGKWIQYLDADDYLLPEKIEQQMAFLQAHPRADVVFSPVIREHWPENVVPRELQPRLDPAREYDLWVLLASWELPQTGGSLWSKKALQDVGGWSPSQPCCQEHELYLRLLAAGKNMAFCPGANAVYRQWSDQTVCKRDLSEVHRRRLEIESRVENVLRGRGELTGERRQAINQARFEIARQAWHYNEQFAAQIVGAIRNTDPNFVPDPSPSAPEYYRLAFRTLGFRMAQTLTQLRRTLVRRQPQT